MSPAPRHPPTPEELERLLARMGQEEVPDPGEAYWSAFPGRVRQRLAGAPGQTPAPATARRGLPLIRWPVWGTLAAALLVGLIYVGMPGVETGTSTPPAATPVAQVADTAVPAPAPAAGAGAGMPAGDSGESAPSGDGTASDDLDLALDTVLGLDDPLGSIQRLDDLTEEEKTQLLETLRGELDALRRGGNSGSA